MRAAPRRILKVPFRGREIDVWEEEGGPDADLLRRDFTVNAIAFELPGGVLVAAPGAPEDLRKRTLRPPRPGVFLEDPLRVLRAARFLALLPGFRIARSAEAEIKAAGRFLRKVSEERRLVELDKLLGAPTAGRVKGLRFLARLGVLQTLIRSSGPGSPWSEGSSPRTRASREPFSSCLKVRREPKIFLESGRPAGRS